MWLKNLNLKKPPKSLYVCSFHFVDKKPTEDNPYPTLFLGYSEWTEKRLRAPRRNKSSLRGTDKTQTQCFDPGMEDHLYAKQGLFFTDKPPQHFCRKEPLQKQNHSSTLGQEEPDPPQVKEEEQETPLTKEEELDYLQIKVEEPELSQIKKEEPEPPHVKEEEPEPLLIKKEEPEPPEFKKEEPEPPHIKKEPEELEENFSAFQQTLVQNQEKIQTQQRLLQIILIPQLKGHEKDDSAKQMNSSLAREPEAGEAAEPDSELLLSQDSILTGSQQQKKIQQSDSGPSRKAELKCKRRRHQKNEDNSPHLPQSSSLPSRKTHTGEGKEHFCATCGKNFRFKSKLLFHMTIHTGEKPHSCVTCGNSFARRCDLLSHMRIHTGEKPHSCVTCGKWFTKRSNLLQHMTVHTGEMPYTCEFCGKGFSKRCSLSDHESIHTGEKPHSCVTCGKGFTRQGNLLDHMRIHTGEKPHSCETCGKGFTQRGTLLCHMRIHTGEKPHSCETCGKSFTTGGNLRKHIKIHSEEKS